MDPDSGCSTTNGFLWDEGRVGGSHDTNWPGFTDILKAAIAGLTNRLAATDEVDILLHIDRGTDQAYCRWFFDQIQHYEVPFDIIALSYYPWWHGELSALAANISALAARYNQDILVVETAYPWTLDWSDLTHNIVGEPAQLHAGFPAAPSGQRDFLCAVRRIIVTSGGAQGRGLCYWAPDYVAAEGVGSPWENLALFDFQTNLLTGVQAFAASNGACDLRITDWSMSAHGALQMANGGPGTTVTVSQTGSLITSNWVAWTNVVITNWAPVLIEPGLPAAGSGFFRLEQHN